MAVISRKEITRVIQQKTGIRIRLMPGARRLRIVTMKFAAATMEAIPRIWRPSSQKSIRKPVENCEVLRFA